MPINFVHSLIHRVEDGWDPIPPEYAEKYADLQWTQIDSSLINKLSDLAGGLDGKRVLDLGGGPGQYSVLFGKAGARVTWHDVSRQYQRIARSQAGMNQIELDFSLGRLEEARKFGPNSFDLVFCRICWYYCRSDRAFARLIYRLVKPGGLGHIQCHTAHFSKPRGLRRLQHELNARLWWKIGHPVPPHGRIASLIHRFDVSYMEADYHSQDTDIVTFVKSTSNDNRANGRGT